VDKLIQERYRQGFERQARESLVEKSEKENDTEL